MNRNFFYILLMVTIFTHTAFACMPNSPADVFIARYESIQKNSTDQSKFNLVLDRQDFIFRTLYQRLTLDRPEKTFSDFKPHGLIRNNLVIGFAYNPDGRVSKRYQLSALAKLVCKNDQISIGKISGNFLAWDRKAGLCVQSAEARVNLLDGFIHEDQNYYLNQLKTKYRTCEALEKAFPTLKEPQDKVYLLD